MLAIAHRGYSSAYPENTERAFDKAIEIGADYVETDLRFSSDGAIVCCHDDNFGRIAKDPSLVEETSLDDIRALSLADGQSIPTLEDVLRIIGVRARVMLDVKITSPRMTEQVIATVRSAGMTRRVIYGARKPDIASAVRVLDPDIAILAMPGNAKDFDVFLGLEIDALRLYEDGLDAESVAAVQAANHPIWVTGGLRSDGEAPGTMTRQRLGKLAAIPAAAVIVNDPTLIVERRTGAIASTQSPGGPIP